MKVYVLKITQAVIQKCRAFTLILSTKDVEMMYFVISHYQLFKFMYLRKTDSKNK